jgi:GT2 family glycosyltransferase/tetratricopeptide (TPR) repeat protein
MLVHAGVRFRPQDRGGARLKYSIIIIAYNSFYYLDKCLDSIRSSHIEDHEVIVVDNSPGQRTPEELAILEKATFIIHPGENLGFAKGCNVGRMQARGEYLVFLNPDTEVYGNWADRLAAHLDSHPEAGAVGPISNFVAGGQNEVFHRGNTSPADALQTKLLIGFCLMIRGTTYDEMGGMDPLLFLGNDDLDLSWRLRLAGYMLLIAPDVFVYHAGHKSMETETKPHIEKLLAESQAHLKAKLQAHYGDAVPAAVDLWGVDFFQTRDKGPLRLSVVMIVRNEAENMVALMPNLAFADEIVVIDTGSTDRTRHIVEYWGGEMSIIQDEFPWIDDFAAARNFAKSKATGDYLLWLDADDRVPEETAKLIRHGLDNPSPDMLRKNCFFDLKVECLVDGRTGESLFQHRILPNVDPLKWTGAVHETVAPSLNALQLTRKVMMDLKIIHTGYDTYDLRLAKAERNMAILRTMPDTPQKYMDMGNAYMSVGQWHEGYGFYRLLLERYERHLGPGFRDHITYKTGAALFHLGAPLEALEYLTHTAKPDALYLRALCLEALGEPWQQVLEAYLALPDAPDTLGSNRAMMVEEARRKLAG